MDDDTLSPYGFSRTIVKTRMGAQERFALAELAEAGEPGQATVRRVLCAGLAAMGWPEEKRIEAYATYAAACIRGKVPNEFESR